MYAFVENIKSFAMKHNIMFAAVNILTVMCVLLNKQVIGKEGKLLVNQKTDLCPNGVIYREGCKLCFCIEEVSGQVTVKCESQYTDEECGAVSLRAHCEPENLLYDYKKECEGECTCNDEMNVTTCEYLPCDNTFLWFLGYYDDSDLPLRTKYKNVKVRTGHQLPVKVVKKSKPERAKRSVPDGAERSVPDGVERSMPERTKRNVPDGVERSMPERTKRSVPERTKRSVRGRAKRSMSETDEAGSTGIDEDILHEPELNQHKRRKHRKRVKSGKSRHSRNKSRTKKSRSTEKPMKIKMGKWLNAQMSRESSAGEYADPESDVDRYKDEVSTYEEQPNNPESNIEEDVAESTNDEDDVDDEIEVDNIGVDPFIEEDEDAHDLTITKYISSQKKKQKKKRSACRRKPARSEKAVESKPAHSEEAVESKPAVVEECQHGQNKGEEVCQQAEGIKGDAEGSCEARPEEQPTE